MPEQSVRAPTDDERRRVQEIIDRHAAERPAEVRRIEAVFGEDWTGYPAVYVNLFVPKDLQPTKAEITALNNYIKTLHDEIIEEQIGFWPYSRTYEE